MKDQLPRNVFVTRIAETPNAFRVVKSADTLGVIYRIGEKKWMRDGTDRTVYRTMRAAVQTLIHD